MKSSRIAFVYAMGALSAQAAIASRACSDLIESGLLTTFTTENKEIWRRRGKRRGYRGR